MDDRSEMFDPLRNGRLNGHGTGDSQGAKPAWWSITPVPDGVALEFPIHHKLGRPHHWWEYRDASGKLLHLVCRWDCGDGEKAILPLTYCEDDAGHRAWRWMALPAPRPLYRLDRLAHRPEAPVLLVEGEKAADAAGKLFPDHVAVTSSGGSNAAEKADWAPLSGRRVVIWPDHDEAGCRYAEDVARLALAAGASWAGIVAVPTSWPHGWDLADALPDGATEEMLRRMLEAAPRVDAFGMDDGRGIIAELAKLSPADYDRQREAQAKALGIRVTTLDAEVKRARRPMSPASPARDATEATTVLSDVEPWHEAVEGKDLLAGIAGTLRRFVILPEGAAEAVALWILFAHAHDASEHSPVLAVQSPEKRCGKTVLLSAVAALVPRALASANISPAALFRAVEKWKPTLLIDEADTFLRDNEDIRGILNSGFARASAFVVRCVGDDFEPRAFSTWCPKLIAGIGKLPDTLQDRAIVVELRRKLAEERVERLARRHDSELTQLRAQAARWALDHAIALACADPEMPAGLHDRAEDCWRPLLAIADLVGGRWPELARTAAVELSGRDAKTQSQSAGTLLLTHIREVLGSRESIGSSELVTKLTARDDWPWGEWWQGRPITARAIARILSAYGIRPVHTRGGSRYGAVTFAEAWRRYTAAPAPGASSVTSVTTPRCGNENNILADPSGRSSSVTAIPAVTDDNAENSRDFKGVTDVTLAAGGTGYDVEGVL